MNFYIKEWPDHTATLMTDIGQVLWKFPSVAEARLMCEEYYRIDEVEVEYREDIGQTTGQQPPGYIAGVF